MNNLQIFNNNDFEKIDVVKENKLNNGLQVGQFIDYKLFGEGIIVGFSSKTSNPIIYFYKEKEAICLLASDIEIKLEDVNESNFGKFISNKLRGF